MNSTVSNILAGSNCKLINESDLRSQTPSSLTATISGATKLHSIFPGIVLFLGYYNKMGTITVAVSNHEIVRYLNLKDIKTWNYASLSRGEYIGEAYPNSPFQFEYCTQWKGSSIYPVRVNGSLYFKQNPIDILDGLYVPDNQIDIQNGVVRLNNRITFTQEQLVEWGPTSIDNSDKYVEGAKIVGG